MPAIILVPLSAALAGLLAGTAVAASLDRFYSTALVGTRVGTRATPGAVREGTRPFRTRPSRTRRATGQGPWGAFRRRVTLLAPAAAILWCVCSLRAVDLRQFLLMAAFGTSLLALSATDFERHLLPNRVMYPSLLAALALSAAWPHRPPLSVFVGVVPGPALPGWGSAAAGATLSALLGGLAGSAIVLAIFLILPGFGFGDVKLGGLIGLILGFPAVLTGLLIGMVLGGIGAGAMLLSGRAQLRTPIAYGPYLAGGAILELLLRR